MIAMLPFAIPPPVWFVAALIHALREVIGMSFKIVIEMTADFVCRQQSIAYRCVYNEFLFEFS